MGEGERQEDSEPEPFEKVPGPLMGSYPVGHCGLPLEQAAASTDPRSPRPPPVRKEAPHASRLHCPHLRYPLDLYGLCVFPHSF